MIEKSKKLKRIQVAYHPSTLLELYIYGYLSRI
jgi:hypothetical protein